MSIFADWNPALHIVEPHDVPDDWPRFVSQDIGGPMMLFAESPDGVLYLLAQLTDKPTGETEHAE